MAVPCEAFQGHPVCFQGDTPFNPKHCNGSFFMAPDGFPAAQVWAHCDDLLLFIDQLWKIPMGRCSSFSTNQLKLACFVTQQSKFLQHML
jgi:hypothetical protein